MKYSLSLWAFRFFSREFFFVRRVNSKRFYASTNSSPLNKRSLDITRNITREQYLLEHTRYISISIYTYRNTHFRCNRYTSILRRSGINSGWITPRFNLFHTKIILHRFILRLMSVASSRAKHNKKYQKPYRSICNVASIRNNGDREGKKGGGKVWERWIYLYHISSEIVIETLLTIILTIILLIINVRICRGFFQYGLNDNFFIFFFWKIFFRC